MPTPAFHAFHNHYDSWHNHCAPHGHHHDTGNTMVLNMCTPCCPQPKPEAKKPPLDPVAPKSEATSNKLKTATI